MAKLTSGVSTSGTCPFTFSLDVGARLYARVQAPQIFGWSGGEYDLTPKWNKGIIEAGTCPDLGPIPSKRDLHLLLPDSPDANYSVADQSLGVSVLEDDDSGENRKRRSSLVKRGGVYGPALSLPVGKFFCPPSSDEDENESSSCSAVKPAWDDDKYLNEDYDNMRKKRSFLEGVYDDGDEDIDADELLEHLFERAINTKDIKACGRETTFRYPTDGSLSAAALVYGWEQPQVCGNFDFGAPLPQRVANTDYHSEHILEAQMVMQFFQYLNEKWNDFDHPDPNDISEISFCEYVDIMFDIPAVVAPGIDTAQGFAARLKPIDHIAAQFPTNQWKTDEYVALEGPINTPAKGKAWGTNGNIINTNRWLTSLLPRLTGARSMLKSMRLLIGSRLYHNDWTIIGILRAQKNRVGDILDLLDNQVLPNNPPQGFTAWQPLGLRAEWDTFMRGEFLMMQTKTMKVINDFLGPLKEHWTSDATKQANEDQPGDSNTVLTRKQETRNLIDDIEAMDDFVRNLPAWQWPF